MVLVMSLCSCSSEDETGDVEKTAEMTAIEDALNLTNTGAAGYSEQSNQTAAYRTAGASKAIPGFDVMDYGQEDYVFGSATADARHWDRHVLNVFEAHQDVLADLFN